MVLPACVLLASLLQASLHVGDAGPTYYDQRQDGKYNVKIHLKDFKLISLGNLNSDSLSLGEYDDSNYDYEDPTEPPEKSTTTTTTTTTTIKAPTLNESAHNKIPLKLDSASLLSNSTIKNVTLESNVPTHKKNSSKLDDASFLSNSTIKNVTLESNVPTYKKNSSKLDDASFLSNSTIKNVTLQSNVPTHSALLNDSPIINFTASTNLTETTTACDCPEKNVTTPRTQVASSSTRPARVQPSHVTRPRPPTRTTPYRPYNIISTTKRPVVKQDLTRKMRCRPGFFRDRNGRCRRVRVQEKSQASWQTTPSPIA